MNRDRLPFRIKNVQVFFQLPANKGKTRKLRKRTSHTTFEPVFEAEKKKFKLY